MYTRAALTARQQLRAELGIVTIYSRELKAFVVTSYHGVLAPVENYSQADQVINDHLDAVQAARATLAALMTTPAAAPKVKRSKYANLLLPTADDLRTGFRLDVQFSNARIDELALTSTDADVMTSLGDLCRAGIEALLAGDTASADAIRATIRRLDAQAAAQAVELASAEAGLDHDAAQYQLDLAA